jgi:hypothetical protein
MKDRKVKQTLSGGPVPVGGGRVCREGERRQILYVYENRTMKPVEIALRRGPRWGMGERAEGE